MPIYLYRNLTTNDTFELEQRITESALTHHPESGEPVKRLIQPVGIAFKGSGFYVNDSRSSSGASKAGKTEKTDKAEGSNTSGESKSESKTESKAEGKSDSKPESKTEKKSESKAAGSS